MRKKSKLKEENPSSKKNGLFVVSPEKKKKLLGILLMVLAQFVATAEMKANSISFFIIFLLKLLDFLSVYASFFQVILSIKK